MKLEPQTVIISGGSGYVGQAVAWRLAKDGFSVALLYHGASKTNIQKILKELPGKNHRSYQCDLRNSSEVGSALVKIAHDYKNVAACVHTAEGKLQRIALTKLTEAEFKAAFEVGVWGGFNLMKAVGELMQVNKTGGVILGVTSAAVEPNTQSGAMGGYIPAKFALRGLLRVLAKELAPNNIRVHALAPGFMPLGLNSDLAPGTVEFLKQKSLTQVLSSAEDVANLASFLCSSQAVHLSGLSLTVSPGDVMEL